MGLLRNNRNKCKDPMEEGQLLGHQSPPNDAFNLAYMTYFLLGTGSLLPWNAFITAVDYFSYLYPNVQVDRVFAVAYMIPSLPLLIALISWTNRSSARIRINLGLSLFLLSLVTIPVMDLIYIHGTRGSNAARYVTVALVGVCGIADALVGGGMIGSAGELPERYMQAVFAGTATSGVLVSFLRILTKGALPQNAHGLRTSANLYFSVSTVCLVLCLACYNMANQLPVIRYYTNLKKKTMESTTLLENETFSNPKDLYYMACLEGASNELYGGAKQNEGASFWHVWRKTRGFGFAILLIYVVTLSIFPGYMTEDVHSHILKDWYPLVLITGYNVFDLVGKSLTAFYVLESSAIAIGGCIARLLFYPLFFACLHGPKFFHSEIPVMLLTCLLGLTNGYLTSVLMIIAPKTVPLQEAETAGIVMALFLAIGLATGSIVGWFWAI
eukprot:Gb_14388 [translate_table: standard]